MSSYPQLDACIVGATVITPQGEQAAEVGIRQGRIVGLYAPGTAPPAAETIDAAGQWLLPGFVDVHFHCRAPGHPEREDFASGTRAAAAGGVTTLCEMPIADPGVGTPAIFEARRALAEADAYVDFALWGGGGAASEADIRGMAAAGAIGFKIFLHGAPPGREREFAGLTATDTRSLYRALEWIAGTGLPCAVHCEDDDLIQVLTDRLRAAGRLDPRAHGESRPAFVEALAVSRVLTLGEALGVRLHFPHISSAWALELITAAKQRGVPATLETCPHYLFRDESAVDQLGPFAKINPPIRSARDRAALWEALLDGRVDIVASDHAPYTVAEKEAGWQDIFRAPSGSPGVETLAPLLLDRVLAGELSAARVLTVLAEAPARHFGLYPRKGALLPGSDADLVLFDPRASWTVAPDQLFTRSHGSARLFAGQTLRGRITRTWVRGVTVYHNGQIVGPRGHGRFVRPGADGTT